MNVTLSLCKIQGMNFHFLEPPQMLSSRDVSLQSPTVISHHECIPTSLIPGLHLFYVLMESLPLLITHWSQILRETDPYVRISNAFWCSCCIQGFWKQSAYWWQVLHSSWPCCCQESSSQPEQKPSMLPVPLHSLSFQIQDLWWADRFEDCQRCKLSTSLWLILEKHGRK